MERKYLSGNIRERLQDFDEKKNTITQSELAAKNGMDVAHSADLSAMQQANSVTRISKDRKRNLRYPPTSCSALPIFPTAFYDIAELGFCRYRRQKKSLHRKGQC